MMAGDWMPLRLDIHGDVAVIGMSQKLKMSPDEVVGKLARVWSWFDRNSTDGVVAIESSWIDQLTGAEGFSEAMVSVGWLIVDSSSVTMPKFDNWLSRAGKRRLQNTEAKRRERDALSVSNMSSSEYDRTATTGQNRTEQNRDDRGTLTGSPQSSPTGRPDGESSLRRNSSGLKWTGGGIQPEEFTATKQDGTPSWSPLVLRLHDALTNGWISDEDIKPCAATWCYIARRYQDRKAKRPIENPGAVFTRRVQNQDWETVKKDEDSARKLFDKIDNVPDPKGSSLREKIAAIVASWDKAKQQASPDCTKPHTPTRTPETA